MRRSRAIAASLAALLTLPSASPAADSPSAKAGPITASLGRAARNGPDLKFTLIVQTGAEHGAQLMLIDMATATADNGQSFHANGSDSIHGLPWCGSSRLEWCMGQASSGALAPLTLEPQQEASASVTLTTFDNAAQPACRFDILIPIMIRDYDGNGEPQWQQRQISLRDVDLC